MPYTAGQPVQPLLDPSSPSPGASRASVVLLLAWSAIEGTVLAFALRPTMSELISDLTGVAINPVVVVVVLSVFMFIFVTGSYVCIQQLKDAIRTRNAGNIVTMVLVQIVVAMIQVMFLYRPLVDALNNWLAPQHISIGQVGAYGLAICGWFAVRGMAWYLLARSGAAALNAALSRSA